MRKDYAARDHVGVKVTSVADPVAAQDAATKSYVDAARVGRNRIINGDFSVNQRGFNTIVSNATFGFDRWSHWFSGGVCTQKNTVPAMSVDLPEQPGHCVTITTSGQAGASNYCTLTQNIESVRTLSGKTVTVSFWAKALSGTPKIGVSLEQAFGAGGSALVSNPVGVVTISTVWKRYSVTGTLPTLVGKTVGTDDYLQINIAVSAGTSVNAGIGIQNNTFDIWGVQVEEGSYATPYEQKTYADELRACQRYFVAFIGSAAGFANNATNARVVYPMPTTIRTTPTVTLRAPGNVIAAGNLGPAVTAAVLTAGYPTTVFVDLTTSGLTAGHGVLTYNQTVEFNMEL